MSFRNTIGRALENVGRWGEHLQRPTTEQPPTAAQTVAEGTAPAVPTSPRVQDPWAPISYGHIDAKTGVLSYDAKDALGLRATREATEDQGFHSHRAVQNRVNAPSTRETREAVEAAHDALAVRDDSGWWQQQGRTVDRSHGFERGV